MHILSITTLESADWNYNFYSLHKQEIEPMNCRTLSVNKVEIYNQLLLKRTKQVTWLNKQQ